ncbi:hypothetical protein E0H73_11280 [Kribbella pittospori]|uniref:Uncharacterized protein n=1 Tax=Kribbella pittospori TaxID=722689 RepID=A0A4R0KSR7_9ACTN|nr:DUF6069 family protein [Kribbella pittospori]TCC63057.1 hypothetical protein E0H73_11280 [Kribbella pittospori]
MATNLTQPDIKQIRVTGRSRLLVVGVTAAAALALWAILAPLAGITLEAQQGALMHIGAGAVFFASAAMAFAGSALPHSTLWSARRSSSACVAPL